MNATIVQLDKISVNSALVVREMGVRTSTMNVAFDFEVQTNSPTASVDAHTNESGKLVEIVGQWDAGMWTAEKGQRFRELARRESLGDLPVEEQAELEELTRLRRSVKNPRSADEILWERRQNRVTNELVRALQNYVEFHKTPHHA